MDRHTPPSPPTAVTGKRLLRQFSLIWIFADISFYRWSVKLTSHRVLFDCWIIFNFSLLTCSRYTDCVSHRHRACAHSTPHSHLTQRPAHLPASEGQEDDSASLESHTHTHTLTHTHTHTLTHTLTHSLTHTQTQTHSHTRLLAIVTSLEQLLVGTVCVVDAVAQ